MSTYQSECIGSFALRFLEGPLLGQAGVGIYFSLDSKTLADGMLRACFALNLRHKRSKRRPLDAPEVNFVRLVIKDRITQTRV